MNLKCLASGCVLVVMSSLAAEDTTDGNRPEPGPARIFSSQALATPYRAELTDAEKAAGIAQVWAEAKYNFANFDLVPDLDWDATYLEYLPKAVAAKTTEDYYRVLMTFVAELKDGHSNVYPPEELVERFYTRPPLYTNLYEDKVVVYLADSKRLNAEGIVEGLEITHIDGMPVHEYAATRVRPYQSSSTPQDLDVRTYNYMLLAGPADEPVKITFRDAAGASFTRAVPRSGYSEDDDAKPYPGVYNWRWVDEGIAYADIRSFNNEDLHDWFDQAYSEFSSARGLIIDLRLNGGGSSSHGFHVLSYLIDEPVEASQWKTRLYRPAFRAWGRDDAFAWHKGEKWIVEPHPEHHFDGRVVVLTSARTFSAAEDFLAGFRSLSDGLIIGEPTGGSTGQPLFFPLPGGGRGRVTSKRDWMADGTEFVGRGFEPDIVVQTTVDDIRAGRDPQLLRAVEELRQNRGRASAEGKMPLQRLVDGRMNEG